MYFSVVYFNGMDLKIEAGDVGSFLLNGDPYQRGAYKLDFDQKATGKIGIQEFADAQHGKHLVKPRLFSEWTDDTDTAYLSYQDFIDRVTPFFFDVASSSSPSSAFQPQNVVYVTDESDLPAPSGGTIALDTNIMYIFYNDNPAAGSKIIDIANEMLLPDFGGIRITSTGSVTCRVRYTGTGTMFKTSGNYIALTQMDSILFSFPNGTFLDFDGALPPTNEFVPRLFLSNMGFFEAGTLGTVKRISLSVADSAFFDFKQGLICDHLYE